MTSQEGPQLYLKRTDFLKMEYTGIIDMHKNS